MPDISLRRQFAFLQVAQDQLGPLQHRFGHTGQAGDMDAVALVRAALDNFSQENDLSTQVRALQLILNQTKIDKNLPKEIDLRFSKVVLRY